MRAIMRIVPVMLYLADLFPKGIRHFSQLVLGQLISRSEFLDVRPEGRESGRKLGSRSSFEKIPIN
jgi:hypothetical protein